MLPTVLWISVLAITVGVSYASSVHLGTRSADNIKTALLLKYDAISGVYLALDQLLARPVRETTRYRLEFNGSDLDIVVTPGNAMTNVNSASADEIRKAMYTPKASRETHQKEVGLKQIQINRCPALAPISLLKDEAIIERTGLSLEQIPHRVANWLTPELADKLCQVFTPRDYPAPDVEASLYSGFASYNDKNLMVEVRDANIDTLTHQSFHFEDPRFSALLFRYKARFFPQTLTHQEQLEWRDLLRERLIDGGTEFLTVQGFDQQITEIQNELANTPNKKSFALLNDLVLFRTKLIG